MNIYQLLEEIMEALADGRQEGESQEAFKKRKAAELKQRFEEQQHKAEEQAEEA